MNTVGILAYADTSVGGVYHYTQSLIDALALDDSHRYIIFTHAGNGYDAAGLEVRIVAPLAGWKRVLLKCAAGVVGRLPFLVSAHDRTIFSDVDLFIAPSSYLYPHLPLGKPFMVTLHDLQHCYFPEFFTLPTRIERHLVYRAAARHAQLVLCESNFVKNDIVNFLKAAPSKVAVIPSPPPSDLSKRHCPPEHQAAVRDKYRLPERYLFYPAQFWPHKNHGRLVRAFRQVADRFPDVHLVLTGMRAHEYPTVMSLVARLGLEERVLHLGYIDYDDMPALYRLAAMLVMPTLFESVSMPVFEAFALGVPVCASNVVALPEQIGDAGLLFDPLDPSDIAAKISALLDDQTLAEELARKGEQRVRGFDHADYAVRLRGAVTAACAGLSRG